MGYYIETPQSLNKAAQLLSEFPSITKQAQASFNTSTSNVTVCVVKNGFFDAAAVAYSKDEFDVFNYSNDYRPKTWLDVPRDVIESLIGQGRCPAGVLRYLPT